MSEDEDAGARERARDAAEAARQLRLQFARACASSGWALQDEVSYLIGVWTFTAMAGTVFAAFVLFHVTYDDFVAALGPGSAAWAPLAALAIGFGVPLGLRALAMPGAERAAVAEEAWAAALPFPVDKDGLARAYGEPAKSRGRGGRLRVTLHFDAKPVPEEQTGQLVERAGIRGRVRAHGREVEIEVEVAGRLDYQVGRARRLRFHDLVAKVLTTVHRDQPIARVELAG